MSLSLKRLVPYFSALFIGLPLLASAQQGQLAPLPPALPRVYKPRPTTPDITVADLMTRLYIFADDSMLGRGLKSGGNAKATAYLAAEARRIGLQPAGDSGTYFQNVPLSAPFATRNVIAILPGSDPVLRHEYVALGAHSDHLGMAHTAVDHDSLRVFNHFKNREEAAAELAKLRRINPPRLDSIYNGADDDGSGSVALLEIAEQLAARHVKLKRSILFVWHTAEESGLLGSAWFVSHPTVPLDSIVVQLNADMLGRGDAWDFSGGGPNYLEADIEPTAPAELKDIIGRTDQKAPYPFDLKYPDPGCNSDDCSYRKVGILAMCFYSGDHSDYHQLTDEPQYIDYGKLARTTSLIGDVAVYIANLDHRIGKAQTK